MQAIRLRRKPRTLQIIDAALPSIPIPPILELIFDYAESVAVVHTLVDAAGDMQPEIEQASAIIMRPNSSEFWLADYYNKIWKIEPAADGWHIQSIQTDAPHSDACSLHLADPLRWPSALCAHPTIDNYFFIAFGSRLTANDGRSIVRIAGTEQAYSKPIQDGVGTVAQFWRITGCICTSDGRTVYVTDSNAGLIRAVDLTADAKVTTVAGDGKQRNRDGRGKNSSIAGPDKLTFYRSPTSKPNSVLFIAAQFAIRRFDIDTGDLTTLKTDGRFEPLGIDCTSTGLLVFGCNKTLTVYTADPTNGEIEPIANGFRFMSDLCIDEPNGRIWLAEERRVQLIVAPSYVFDLS